MKISINAEVIFTFNTFSQWINKAGSNIAGFPSDEKIICIDQNGNACNSGKDFWDAWENKIFPVTAYRLIRSGEEIL